MAFVLLLCTNRMECTWWDLSTIVF